jgi:hypothetical protein
MRGTGGRLLGGLLCTIVVAVASAIFGVASAGAQITSASITSPSSPYI